jgi:hypothetical protein
MFLNFSFNQTHIYSLSGTLKVAAESDMLLPLVQILTSKTTGMNPKLVPKVAEARLEAEDRVLDQFLPPFLNLSNRINKPDLFLNRESLAVNR